MIKVETTPETSGFQFLSRSGRTFLLLSVLVVATIGAVAGLMIWQTRQAAFEERRRDMESMGVVLSEQTARYVQVIDLVVREVQARTVSPANESPAEFRSRLGTPEIQTYLAECVQNVPQASAIVLIDANGSLFNSSRAGPVARVGADDQDYYTYFREHDDPGMLIGSVSKGRVTGALSLFFARRVRGSDGQFLGVIVGIVKVGYLSEFYRTAAEPLGQAVTLLRRDGTMLMRYPDPFGSAGVKLPQGSPWYRRVAEGGGSYFTSGTLDGIRALVSVRPLKDYPLVLDIVMDERLILAGWRIEAAYIAGFALAAALSFCGLFGLLARHVRRQEEQTTRLEEAAVLLREGQETLRAYAEMSADWFWEQGSDLRFKFVSGISFLTAGSDDTGKTRRELGDPAMQEERWAMHEADLTSRLPFRNFRWERIGPDGARHFMSTNGDPVFDRNGVFSGYRGTGREITAEVQANARLEQANLELELGRLQFDAVLANIPQGVCFFDHEKRLLLWNRRYTEIYNLPPEAAHVGWSLEEIALCRHAAGSTPAEMSPFDYLAWREQINDEAKPSNTVVALRNGRFVSIYYQPMPGGGWIATHEDVTLRQQADASIAFMARHDALTKLPNRVLFRERMERALAMAGRGVEFAVICLDLDNFKHVNDTLGHPVGDGLLVAAAERLQTCVREGDTVARLGGDEFAVIQLAVQQPDDAAALASRVIAAFRQPFNVDGHQVMVGVSIGVTVAPGDSASYETLMRDADIALYLAKTEGRGTARFFEPEMDTRIHLRRMLERDLQGAVARNELELYYQPLVSLISNKVVGFEALLRWHHPARGIVSPLDFIPVAEETGMIVGIGEWVLRTACFEAENWPTDVSLAVNLSPVQFRNGELIATVEAALAASGLSPDRLELEITESVLLRDTADTLAALHQLRAMGIGVALDDFGTGYSSLSYLNSFPFSKIKIDQSFVRGLISSKESMSIIRAVTGLGQSLGIKTIAEGVETEEQLNRLQEEGCTEAQGYFFSRPRPAAELPLLIEQLSQIGQTAP